MGRLTLPAVGSDDRPVRDAVLAEIVRRASGLDDRPALTRRLAALAYRRVSADHLGHVDPDVGARALADALHFLDGLRPGRVAVRVTDPVATLDGVPVPGSVVEIACEDRPFIVTTVHEELHRLGYRVLRTIHPVYGVRRAREGRVEEILPARQATRRESFLQAVLGARVPADEAEALVLALESVLADVVTATDDHERMRAAVAEVQRATRLHAPARFPAGEVDEAVALLAWLMDDNFVLLGCSDLDLDGRPRRLDAPVTLGMLARPGAAERLGPVAPIPEQLVAVSRSRVMSSVHRRVPVQRVDVLRIGAGGDVTGIFRLAGVISRKADAEPAAAIPLLRDKLQRVLELEDVVPGSHDETVLRSLFQVLPKDELFQAPVEELRSVLAELLAAEHEHDVRVILRPEPAARAVSVLVMVPRERYTQDLREQVERFCLSQLDGVKVDTSVSLGDRAEATIWMVVYVDDAALPVESLDPLAREIRMLCRTWEQALTHALDLVDETQAELLAHAYGDRLPPSYREASSPAAAAQDVLDCHALSETGEAIRIVVRPEPEGARLKVFSNGAPIELSAFLPILESLGLWVVDERSHGLRGSGPRLYLHDFGVRDRQGTATIERAAPLLAEAALAMWQGDTETDGLNELVLRAALGWPDVAVLRAYERFRRQVGTVHTTGYTHEAFVQNPDVARALVSLFEARFRPPGTDQDTVDALRGAVEEACDAVERLDHDRILRGFLGLVDATLRTNRYTRGPALHLALKFDSARVPAVPRPVPFREIFVHAPAVEGVHLRWGPVARGGIRHSERLDDYRAETLGLMRAQVLKNAAIVPTGAKGAFVVKRSGARGAQGDQPHDAYVTFVTGLLELTDNVADGTVVRAITGAEDGGDPYLVVAPDRGTATLSDVANKLSGDRGFWLGDAFASGGSSGYDHRRLGITARGAWLAARRHFHELGIDVQSEPCTAVGIGDMSGDVFGNGMLQSRTLRLIAAFDHRHIFVDPDPDPEAAWEERRRLHALPNSTWKDYAPAAFGPGGGVHERSTKNVDLSPGARQVLGLPAGPLAPADVIRAILAAPVDLLYAGGVGTFVRASDEPDNEVDDRLNADVRVDAASLRARVIVEGANLALTQRARIEYARHGGRINTDAIDNAAGVSLSDREVNLKLLLDAAIGRGLLTGAERHVELKKAESAVVTAVLADCGRQLAALSRELQFSAAQLEDFEALLERLEDGVLDRAVEALPSPEEFRRRKSSGAGLTRPELAVLLAGAKRALDADLLKATFLDDPELLGVLAEYFPATVRETLRPVIEDHPLRRQIVSSRLASGIVDRMGVTFADRVADAVGSTRAEVVLAYRVAVQVCGGDRWWSIVDGCADRGLVELEQAVATALRRLLRSLAVSYLLDHDLRDTGRIVADHSRTFIELEHGIGTLGTQEQQTARLDRAARLMDLGLTALEAARAAGLQELEIVPGVAAIAAATGRDATAVAGALLRVTDSAGLARLLALTRRLDSADAWNRTAAQGVVQDVWALRDAATRQALEAHPDSPPEDAVRLYLGERRPEILRALRTVAAAEDAAAELGPVTVALRAVSAALR